MIKIKKEVPRLLKPIETVFVLQWHVTNRCGNRCVHCYLTDEEKSTDKPDILTLEESFGVVDDLVNFSRELHVRPRINFSGGDPLIREDFSRIMYYASKKGVVIGILGNPNLLDQRNLELLRDVGVHRYQVSLEGLKETHDMIRGRGSYNQTLEKIGALNDIGIWPSVMSTVSRQNYREIPELCEVAFEAGARHFDFARIVPIGEGEAMKDLQLGPLEYREFLFNMQRKYEELMRMGARPSYIGRKDPLWYLFDREMGISLPLNDTEGVIEGCSVGKNGLCLDVNGDTYSCRRMPIVIGNVRTKTLKELFFSDQINLQRSFENIEGCGTCDLMAVCRGCRAVAYANTGNYFSKDPQCWRGE